MDRIDPFLNDAEINYLADLFLSCFPFDRGSRGYRYFKNAVVLSSRGLYSYSDMLPRLAACAGVDVAEYSAELTSAISALPAPPHELFNSYYSDDLTSGRDVVRMPMSDTPDRIVSFLGTAFLYILVSYYPKYGNVVDLD